MTPSTIEPANILRELNDLWGALAGEHAGEGQLGVLRACAMSLVVLEDASVAQSPVGETLAALMKDHPCRAIVVRIDPGGARSLEANVTAQCWMPFGRLQQICCEQIEIDSTTAALGDLPPVIRGLTVPDLPLVVWCRNFELLWSCDLEPLLAQADKLVVNSTGCVTPERFFDWLRSHQTSRTVAADLSWGHLTCWRELIAQVFENPSRRKVLHAIESATVSHAGELPPVQAVYLDGWLRGALPPDCRMRFSTSPNAKPGGEVTAVELRAPSLMVSIRRTEGETGELRVGSLIRTTAFRRLNEYELLREELTIQGNDAAYESVLRTVLAARAE